MCKIALAIQRQRDIQVAIPVVYAVQNSGAHMVFPFTRQLLGTVWRSQSELSTRTFREVTESDQASFLARRLALPVEVVLDIAGSLEDQASRSCAVAALEEWRRGLMSPNSTTRFSLACLSCGVFLEVTLHWLLTLPDAAKGIVCSAVNRICLEDNINLPPPSSPSPPPSTRSPLAAVLVPPRQRGAHRCNSLPSSLLTTHARAASLMTSDPYQICSGPRPSSASHRETLVGALRLDLFPRLFRLMGRCTHLLAIASSQ